jgi:hypothetical protein
MIENRKAYRLPFRGKFLYGTKDRVSTGSAVNVSAGGIFVTAFDVLPRDTLCRCVFALSRDEEPVSLEAAVKRVVAPSTDPEQIPGMGFSFVDPDSEAARRVLDFMVETRMNYEVMATILASGEPDLVSLQPLLAKLHVPPFADLGELRQYVERILRAVELVDRRAQAPGMSP